MSLSEVLIASGLVVLAFVTVVWLLSLVLRNATVIDIFWGLGFVVLGALYFLLTDGYLGRKVLVLTLVAIWGLRLSIYLLWRNWGKTEEFRHSELRERRGDRFWWSSYIELFFLQGAALFTISLPLLAAQINDHPDHFTIIDLIGTLVWTVGLLFEVVGDWQLIRFKADSANEGRVMRGGLWAYTRHPNYFGDAVLWWGFFLIAVGTPDGYLTAFSPILMTLVLTRLSGVGIMEPHLKTTKPGYKEYIATTSAFFPWFPAK